ncbi:hypothetical protein ACFB49_45730 [Sphingomonas sp. DBB INV C78]|uniref:putative bifunctional diguanylate cyclase/phosphodiesterase n=1 Tax=Sphingomonas sp. DBB INV C78 TaxID=3349434 RepID=UPI0036D2397C
MREPRVAEWKWVSAVRTLAANILSPSPAEQARPVERRLLSATVDAARTAAPADTISMLVVNLDRFRQVNAVSGHAAGDRVLAVTTDRIAQLAHAAGGQLARLGGDEFACIIGHADGGDAPFALARRIVEDIARPIELAGRSVELGASIGIVQGEAAQSADDLLRAASIAMGRAKREGGATFRLFEPTMDFDLRDRAALEDDLRGAIRNDQFLPFFQPIFALRSGDLVGFESLARWRHPTRGLIDPSVFIPIAEDLDQINEMCFALLRQACRDARDWPAHLTLSINVSPLQISNPDLPLRILQILYAGGLAPGRLIVEITESALVHDLDAARSSIASLRNAGIKVALDDFGTGYSSLHHLRELQFDRIKIDRSFIETLDSFAGDKIVRAIVDLGHGLGMPVTAEGVETIEQADSLSRLGCAYGQGFLFGRPMPAHATLALIAEAETANGERRATA